ncbi:unnamed protein product [Lymnaea stagnalis]|uniref:H-type lectin domain-containing protein n=1 Tax=Lymnaea stagnalis TaxID=6523 RepID=A0AAV2IH70_LYMST
MPKWELKSMMGYSYIYLTAILVSLLLGNEGSPVVFTAQPTFVMYGFPQILSLGCSLDYSQMDEDEEIQSIFITRGPTKQKQTETVAFITLFEPATAKADLGAMNVTGHLNYYDTEGEGYLDVEWQEPGEKQASVYECKIKTTRGMKKATESINYIVPDNKQLLDKLSALEKSTLNKFETIEKSTLQKIDEVKISVNKELVDKISTSEKATFQKIDVVEKNVKKELGDKIYNSEMATFQRIETAEMNVKKALIDKMSVSEKATLQKVDTVEKIVNLRIPAIENNLAAVQARHMETGDAVGFKNEFDQISGHVRRLTKIVPFRVSYKTAPTVYAAISKLDVGNGSNLRIRFYIVNITTSSFTLEIDTWADTVMHEVQINWLSYDSK